MITARIINHLHFFEQLDIRAKIESKNPGTISKSNKSIIRLINDDLIHYSDTYQLATLEKATKYEHKNSVIKQKKVYPNIISILYFLQRILNFYCSSSFSTEFYNYFLYLDGNVMQSPSASIGIITKSAEQRPTQKFSIIVSRQERDSFSVSGLRLKNKAHIEIYSSDPRKKNDSLKHLGLTTLV